MNAEVEKIERNPQEKFVVLYDTAKKCLLILDSLYADFENATLQASDATKVKDDPSVVINIYIFALGLIDYFHRYHEIISGMNLIRKRQPELKKLKSTLKPIKECRNYLQHMRNKLMTNDPIEYPILGAISWVIENRNYMLCSSQPMQNLNLIGIPYDKFAEKYAHKYLLIVGGHTIQIDTVYNEVKTFWKWLEEVIHIEPSHIKDYAWGKPMIIHTEIKK